jgi:hypothetical protein
MKRKGKAYKSRLNNVIMNLFLITLTLYFLITNYFSIPVITTPRMKTF